jgi:hypothetical protein
VKSIKYDELRPGMIFRGIPRYGTESSTTWFLISTCHMHAGSGKALQTYIIVNNSGFIFKEIIGRSDCTAWYDQDLLYSP